MPLYTYTTEDGKLSQDIFYHMNDNKPQEFLDEFNVKWIRDWGALRIQGVVDGKINAWSAAKFVEKTAKPGKMKDIYDRSRELSERRKQESGDGIDPISVKAREKYAAERHGKKYISPQEVADKVVKI